MQNSILFQAYGGADFLNECRFALLHYLQVYNLTPPSGTSVVIYTDAPEAFSDFAPYISDLQLVKLPAETVQEWKGKHQFVHRVKIKMFIDFFERFERSVLYCDTDTYLTAPLQPLFENLAKGLFYMHQYEGVISKEVNPSFHKWERFLSATPISFNHKTLEFANTLQMFNAGAVGVSHTHQHLLHDVLALTDAIYEKFPKHIAEQFAFSYCLQKAGIIKTADHLIAHYWNLKEFRVLLKAFFTQNAEESIPNQIKKLHFFDPLSMQQEKQAFKQLPYLQRLWKKVRGKEWRIANYGKRL